MNIPLWNASIPGFDPDLSPDIPALTPYLLRRDRHQAAVIVCPGGGYTGRAPHEGEPIARWLNRLGLSAFVLTYRVFPYHFPIPLLDIQRAIRTVRSRAEEFGLDPQRIGILGFSAGGHLASTAATHHTPGDPHADDPVERHSSHPDALILCYPVITFGEHRHEGSLQALLGDHPSEAQRQDLSNETRVTGETPPTFLFHTANDASVPVENSLLFAASLSRCQVPFELHVFQDGSHGVGLAGDDPFLSPWTGLCENWLRKIGFLGTGTL